MKITPNSIYTELSQYVHGQEEAKKKLAMAGFLHLAKSELWLRNMRHREPTKKSNVLIMGPSGCGKTYMVNRLAICLDKPFLEINAKALVNEGFQGTSITEYFKGFMGKVGIEYSQENFLTGVVFIDEFDKLGSALTTKSGGDWNLEIQNSLLKVIEGSPIGQSSADTSGMLFILGGNFKSIRDARANTKRSIGFDGTSLVKTSTSLQQDLMQAGISREMVGRISIITEIQELTRSDMVAILKKTKDSVLDQYKELYLRMFHKELVISNYVLNKIVQTCLDKKVGARGLQSALDEYICKKIFNDKDIFVVRDLDSM